MLCKPLFKFINHASILISVKDHKLLTDPWYASNAFGAWYQHPAPNKDDILHIIENSKQLNVVVSHGHDDHLDDWFIYHHLRDSHFFIPEFPSPGLKNRLSEKTKVKTTLIGEHCSCGPFTLRQFINKNFTGFDAVITIEFNDKIIIHANDNWHEWPENMISEVLSLLKKYKNDNVFYLTQFGIADCFPVNYPQIKTHEAKNIILNRLKSYDRAIKKNIDRLNIPFAYIYANQSKFEYGNKQITPFYEAVQSFLKNNQQLIQLVPGDQVFCNHKIVPANLLNSNFFKFRLDGLQKFINDRYMIENPSGYIPLSLQFISSLSVNNINTNQIIYATDPATWNLILTGEINLESITIGGCGVIFKPDINIRDHHIFISKISYVIQNKIKKEGINFFIKCI